jgi:hypothetical protein
MPSLTPSTSVAPSVKQFFILIRIQTDYFPQETSWKLKTGGGKTLAQRPAGYFTKEVTIYDEVLAVPENQKLFLEVYDVEGDGIHNVGGGYVTVYFGKTANSKKVFRYSDGNFQSKVVLEILTVETSAFDSMVPTGSPTNSLVPSVVPTSYGACPKVPSNGCSICGEMRCATAPDTFYSYKNFYSCGELETAGLDGLLTPAECAMFASTISDTCGCALASKAPRRQPSVSPSPSSSPTTSMAPSRASEADFLLVFHTDQFPEQSAWSLRGDNGLIADVRIGELENPNTDETTLVRLMLGQVYTLTIFDTFGNGLCKFQNQGPR